MTREQFDMIKEKHGQYASWAVWAAVGDTAKSNVGDTSILDPIHNPQLLATLNPNVVMLGLNLSRSGDGSGDEPLSNFHDKKTGLPGFVWGNCSRDFLKV